MNIEHCLKTGTLLRSEPFERIFNKIFQVDNTIKMLKVVYMTRNDTLDVTLVVIEYPHRYIGPGN